MNGVQGAGGSNPLVPTSKISHLANIAKWLFFGLQTFCKVYPACLVPNPASQAIFSAPRVAEIGPWSGVSSALVELVMIDEVSIPLPYPSFTASLEA